MVVASCALSAAGHLDLPPHVLLVETSDHSVGLVEKQDEVRDFVIDATRPR